MLSYVITYNLNHALKMHHFLLKLYKIIYSEPYMIIMLLFLLIFRLYVKLGVELNKINQDI